MVVQTARLLNNPYIGLFLLATDRFCLAPDTIERKDAKMIEDVLGVDVILTRVSGTSLIGVFAAGNSNGVVLPWITYEDEVQRLEDAGIKTLVLKDKVTALGNLVEANDKGAVVSPLIRRENVEYISKHLGVKAVQKGVGGMEISGAAVVATNKGFLAHPNVEEPELKELEKLFGVKGDTTTANFGDPFVGASIVANSNGVLVGDKTTPVELLKIEDVLG